MLRKIGDQRHVSIANVATRWVLDHDFVGAALIGKFPRSDPAAIANDRCYVTSLQIGARLGVSDNTDDNLAVFGWRLTKEDHMAINTVLNKSNGRKLIKIIGDCGAEYR